MKKVIPPEDYESIVLVENGKPLTDLFPNGILIGFNENNEINYISDVPVVSASVNWEKVDEMKKFHEWREFHSDSIDWETFRDTYWECPECKTYVNQPCVCYAR